ncbi:hypothetical protein EDB89DRAFT_1911509 [Lactarius sanguifluus]|nr:hypothetical protein EDB89DRAFT_1911509 [Lactarius sanguifluus]
MRTRRRSVGVEPRWEEEHRMYRIVGREVVDTLRFGRVTQESKTIGHEKKESGPPYTLGGVDWTGFADARETTTLNSDARLYEGEENASAVLRKRVVRWCEPTERKAIVGAEVLHCMPKHSRVAPTGCGSDWVVPTEHEQQNVDPVDKLGQRADVVLFHIAAPDRGFLRARHSRQDVVRVWRRTLSAARATKASSSCRRRVRRTEMDGRRTEHQRCGLHDEAEFLTPQQTKFPISGIKSNSGSAADMDDQDQDVIKRCSTSDLELVFKDDAGVTHKSNKFKDSILCVGTSTWLPWSQYSPPHAKHCVKRAVLVKGGMRRSSIRREGGLFDRQDVDKIRIEGPRSTKMRLSVPLSPIWPAPIRSPTFLLAPVRDVPEHTHPVQRTDPLPAPTHSPAFLHSPTESAHVPVPLPPQRIIVSTPTGSRTAQRTAHPTAAHVPCSQLPVLARISKRFSAAAQLALYRTLELSADDADACVAQPAGASHLAALVTTLALRAYPPYARPVLCTRANPAFDVKLLATAPGTLSHLTLLTDTLPYAFFDDFLAAPARASYPPRAPHFVGVPHAAHDVPLASALRLAVARHRQLRHVTARIASTLYGGLRPAALFGALGGSPKELLLVLALDVDVPARMVIRHAGEYERGAGCTRVAQGHFRRGLASSAVRAGRMPVAERTGASFAPPADISADRGWKSGPSRPARPLLGSALRRVLLPALSGSWNGEIFTQPNQLDRRPSEPVRTVIMDTHSSRYKATFCAAARPVYRVKAEECGGAMPTAIRAGTRPESGSVTLGSWGGGVSAGYVYPGVGVRREAWRRKARTDLVEREPNRIPTSSRPRPSSSTGRPRRLVEGAGSDAADGNVVNGGESC